MSFSILQFSHSIVYNPKRSRKPKFGPFGRLKIIEVKFVYHIFIFEKRKLQKQLIFHQIFNFTYFQTQMIDVPLCNTIIFLKIKLNIKYNT